LFTEGISKTTNEEISIRQRVVNDVNNYTECCKTIRPYFPRRVLYPGRIGIWSVLGEGGKPENPEKNPWSKDENQQQTQPTYDTRPELNPGHIGGRRALSSLGHPCSPSVA